MTKLGKSERQYCLHHDIPLGRLFDANGEKPAYYKEIMSREEKWAAFGVTQCLRGHELRTKEGNCLMCNPQTVAHMLRTKLQGYLYVAIGAGQELMKLGFSQNPSNRVSIANYDGWGGHRDWRLVVQGWSKDAGKLERELQSHFQHTQVPLSWVRNGKHTSTKESYRANVPEAASKLVWLCDDPIEILNP